MSRPIVVTVCMGSSSESWEPYQPPLPWHSRAGGGAVHSIMSGCEQPQQRSRLLDHLVGPGKQRGRDFKAECLGGLEVDYELKARRLDNRQVGRFLTFEDTPSIPSCFSTYFIAICAVTHQ